MGCPCRGVELEAVNTFVAQFGVICESAVHAVFGMVGLIGIVNVFGIHDGN